jgi:hypothetical protein
MTTDSTKSGFLESTATGVLSAGFDDNFQAWLAEALDIPPANVCPVYKADRVKTPDACTAVYFQFNQYSRTGLNYRQTEDATSSDVYGTVLCTVSIYGNNAREKALLLIDAGDFEQNTVKLTALGLGWAGASLQALFTESVGSRLRLRADVQINFNYKYGRDWAVRKITAANPKFIFNQ